MGKQDQLAVIAAGKAVQQAGVSEDLLRSRTGIYLCVGYIPFERSDIEPIAKNSTNDGDFSPTLFSTAGFEQVNPLLTFRCLPNMPIFHVSLNLGIQGPYFITYPGAGQFYLALEQAVAALNRREIDVALVGGVADQNNFLVQHHFKRWNSDWTLVDAAGFLCIQRSSPNPKIEWLQSQISYQPIEPYNGKHAETFCGTEVDVKGAASLPVLLSRSKPGEVTHHVETSDGITASSRWRVLRASE